MGRKSRWMSSSQGRFWKALPFNFKAVLISALLVCSLAGVTGDGDIHHDETPPIVVCEFGMIWIQSAKL